jgi:hypothetical protein
MQAFVRWSLLTVPLLGMAACSPPPPIGPEADGGSPPYGRARGFIDTQLSSHPDGTEPGLTGIEASVIYRNYLRSIGRQFGGSGQQGGGQLGQGGGASGGPGSGGGTGGSYP